MLQIGVSTNNECGKNYEEILTNIKNAGFENIMLSYKSGEMNEVMQKIKQLGLNVCYFHIDYDYGNDIWAKGEAVDKYINKVINQIRFCGENNIKIAVMHSTNGSPINFACKPNKLGLINMMKVLKVAEENNVVIALENTDNNSQKHMSYLLKKIKSPNLMFCYDVGHHHIYNKKLDLLKKHGDRLVALHLHDNLMDWHKRYDYTRDLHMIPFDGKIDFVNVCKKLNKLKYSGIVMLELHKITNGSPRIYDEMENVEYLKKAYAAGEKLAKMIEN